MGWLDKELVVLLAIFGQAMIALNVIKSLQFR
ncbi:MAG: hypothetical protein ACI90U_001878 [Pseudomonadales bacterium]|jgi:hypothetical protein